MISTSEKFGGRFEIKRELGKGASAQVFLAFDTYEQRDVALKITNPNLFSGEEDGARQPQDVVKRNQAGRKTPASVYCANL